jgi:hypothetical protein
MTNFIKHAIKIINLPFKEIVAGESLTKILKIKEILFS